MTLNSIYADGGASQNSFLMQFVSDITRLDVLAAQTPELSALGAVFAGMLGMGVQSSLSDLETLPANFMEYKPQFSPVQVDALLAG